MIDLIKTTVIESQKQSRARIRRELEQRAFDEEIKKIQGEK